MSHILHTLIIYFILIRYCKLLLGHILMNIFQLFLIISLDFKMIKKVSSPLTMAISRIDTLLFQEKHEILMKTVLYDNCFLQETLKELYSAVRK